ncbi:MAG: RNA polymerase sigma factor [Spirochaetes bacterium]|nr:RNA polymerase sigma factor [Spirochaetota bacterium]
MISNKEISELYDASAGEVYVYIFSFVKSKEISEDILHDAFIRLLRHAGSEKLVNRNLRALLYTTARNLCIDYLRKEKRSRETILDENVKNNKEQPGEDMETRELQERIYSILDSIEPVARSIFVMKKELGLTYAEIASRLGISERTIKRKMQKITEKLVAELKKDNYLF